MRQLVSKHTLRHFQKNAEGLQWPSCTVSRLSPGMDEDGYDTTVETPVYSGHCRVRPYGPQTNEQVSVGSPSNSQRYIVSFPVGTDVRDGDIVRIEDRRLPLYLRGSHDVTFQSAVRMQAEEVSNA